MSAEGGEAMGEQHSKHASHQARQSEAKAKPKQIQAGPGSKPAKVQAFDYDLDFAQLDFRAHPELYRIGKGEQGVLLVEPYKSEILPHWRFKDPEIARASAEKIYALFEAYLQADDFPGADMARKFLQMGYTRARRYANHRSGRKYASNPQTAASEAEAKALRQQVLAPEPDPLKAESAEIFRKQWQAAEADPNYQALKAGHLRKYPCRPLQGSADDLLTRT